ncbi:MAG TPA: glycoside hydrolase family 27 protein, partial [Bryobacteraceae bacterium]|nr:glycoside hydrolase family 27 protein [Bryobacteraceae bacterium]
MRWLRCVAVAVACLGAASAQSLTGRWEARMYTGDEGRKMVLNLNQSGATVTGYLLQPNSLGVALQGGTVNGSTVTFFVERPGRGARGSATPPAPVRIDYTATLQGDKLVMTMPAGGRFGGGMINPLEFTRVSTAAPGELPVMARITLTSYKPVADNGLARTPPMGWNSWNKFAGAVTDKDVRDMADAMAANGMKAAGYTYINIDDTWEAGRDSSGNIQSNSKFPNMKALADYVHSKGLKIGIYSSPGPFTCAGYEGSFNHEEQDAKQYAAWGFDYLKYDWCSASQVYTNDPDHLAVTQQAAYAKMGEALLHSGRKIVFSLCQYGQHDVGSWGAKVGGNLWRTTGDISDRWQSMVSNGFQQQVGREKFAAPGHWNDPDMLEIGNGHMTDEEYRTHMSLWCLLSAPLLAGNDLRSMTPSIVEILTNREVIAVDQDKLGKQAVRVFPPVPQAEADTISVREGRSETGGDVQVFARPLADGGHAVGLFNLGDGTAKVTAKWSDIGIKGSHKVRDLW